MNKVSATLPMRPLFPGALAVLSVMLAAAQAGCGGGQSAGEVDYGVSAKSNYEKGLEALEEENWVAAAKYFSFIKARFPYSKYANLAELRLADAEFGAGHYLQAIDGYKLFIKFHPTHPKVENGYAAFKIGESYYEMLPDDWFILPPSYEKDQSASQDAHRELGAFLKKYPKSPHKAKASDILRTVNYKLARHETYVARFYWDRDRPMGTVLRLRRLLSDHPGVGLDAEALYLLGRAYVKVEMPGRARAAWERLVREFPKDDNAGNARAALKRLSG